MMYDFFLYTGAATKDGKKVKVTGPYAVRKLLETLPKNQHYRFFFDNWFCTWICFDNRSPLAFWFQLQQDLIELANVPLWQKKI